MSRSDSARPSFISPKEFVTAVTQSADWRGYPSLLYERCQDPNLHKLQTSMYADKFNIDRYLVVERMDSGHVFYRDRVTGDASVFFATGFATMACIPPITFSTHLNHGAPHKWNQTVKLTGLFHDAFSPYKQGYDNLAQRLLDECSDGRYSAPAFYAEQHPVIQASTPILSRTSQGAENKVIPKEVDPHNILRGICELGAFSYMEENDVLYQSIFDQEESGAFQIGSTNPARIRRGALVEVGMSFIGVPFSDNRAVGTRIDCRLEQVLLVSDEVSTILNRPRPRLVSPVPLPSLSRKRPVVDLTGSYKRFKSAPATVGAACETTESGSVVTDDRGYDAPDNDTRENVGAQTTPSPGTEWDVNEDTEMDMPGSIASQFTTMRVA